MKKFLLEQSEVPDGSDYGSKFNTFYPQVQVLAQKNQKMLIIATIVTITANIATRVITFILFPVRPSSLS